MADYSDVSHLPGVREAIALIDRVVVEPRLMVASSLEHVPGHFIQKEVVADRDYPPVDQSIVDGFAVHASEATSGAELTIAGEIFAGGSLARPLRSGECVRITTGGALPQSADACVPVEHTTLVSSTRIRINRPPALRHFISGRASQCSAGETLLTVGSKLTPAALGICAQVGASRPLVAMRPRVAVLTSGDEIIPYYEAASPTQMRNSNALLLGGLLLKLDCTVKRFEHAADDPIAMRVAVKRILDSGEIDVLFISGGMSVGERDYAQRVLSELKFDTHIEKLRIKPGKPFVFASRSHRVAGIDQIQHVFGLPGNPVSGFVCTLVLASRLLTRLSGGEICPDLRECVLENDLASNGAREFYQPAVVTGSHVRGLHWNGSADTITLARANAFIVRPEHAPESSAGQTVSVLMFPM